MSGGITQLVAVGVQDAYLSGAPEVSFFRSSFKRYTHHTKVVERQIIQGTPTANGVSLLRFEKKGDLLTDVYFTANDPNNTANVNVNWNQIISKLELMIGGQIIDTQDMTYCSNIDPIVNSKSYSQRYVASNVNSSVFFPLKFFFCREWQSALPLIALQYHDVEIRITWAQPNSWDQYIAWARFVYLDNDEREWFAKNKHDMLITQVTRVPIAPVNTFEFALAQPIKYIAFESNNYNTVYNSGGLTSTIPLLNSTGVAPGAGITIPNYLPSNTYVSGISGSTITTTNAVLQSIPANTLVNFSAPISNTFVISSVSGSIVTLTSSSAAIAALASTPVAVGWQVFISGQIASSGGAQLVIEYTVATITSTTLTLAASAAPSISGTIQLTFIPPYSLFNSISAINTSNIALSSSTGPAIVGTTLTITTASAHGIPTTASGYYIILNGPYTFGGTTPPSLGSPLLVASTASTTTITVTVTSGATISGAPAAGGTITIVPGGIPITQGVGLSALINGSGSTYISVNVPGAVSESMVGWNIVIPQTSSAAGVTAAIGTITAVEQSNPESNGVFAGVTGDAYIVASFPSTGTYGTTALTVTANAQTGTQCYIYPSTVYTSAVASSNTNQGSVAAANMQFKMQINGNDVGESRALPHWVDVNQYYLTPYGYYNLSAGSGLGGIVPVAIVPFCLDTARFQPTGSLNFSRIDTFRLICPSGTNFQALSKLGAGSYFYAVNYNILRIQNGMGAVMYSS
jgi:Major capsid protein N-terminus/Large eukaryotic DNA virus major capsid protein